MNKLNRRTLIAAASLTVSAAIVGCVSPSAPTPTRDPSTGDSPEMTPQPSASSAPRALLVFFSRAGENYWEGGRRVLETGNTAVVAQFIADSIECDSYEIRAADPYPEAYGPTVERNLRENLDDARPAIDGDLPDVSGYDAVLIGSPVWNSRAPMIMSTFVESVDLTGKTVLPFVTNAMSGMSGIDDDYREALPGATVVDGLAVRGEEATESRADVEAWLRENSLLP